mmetsp:Transcript_145272/g.253500  ORF Transcript_145272/g.253500 Transcript_145272/m.253500 type:complete len:253 (-) Transcript_145272:353-1111(-)
MAPTSANAVVKQTLNVASSSTSLRRIPQNAVRKAVNRFLTPNSALVLLPCFRPSLMLTLARSLASCCSCSSFRSERVFRRRSFSSDNPAATWSVTWTPWRPSNVTSRKDTICVGSQLGSCLSSYSCLRSATQSLCRVCLTYVMSLACTSWRLSRSVFSLLSCWILVSFCFAASNAVLSRFLVCSRSAYSPAHRSCQARSRGSTSCSEQSKDKTASAGPALSQCASSDPSRYRSGSRDATTGGTTSTSSVCDA